jgi:ribosomal protein S18 acetylase RimI-like enzyme
LLALCNGEPAGVIALRPLENERDRLCEMKRLYVRDAFRGHSIGRVLAERVIAEAVAIGYTRMRLDTVPGKMDRAIALYRDLGFMETMPYYHTPVGETVFMDWCWQTGSRRAADRDYAANVHRQFDVRVNLWPGCSKST